MEEKHLMNMNIAANLLTAYYTARNSFCVINTREPDLAEKEKIFKTVLTSFENLTTSYYKDIENIAQNIR